MLEDGEYRCVCGEGWAGRDCGIRLETECSDKRDNDNGESSVISHQSRDIRPDGED